MASYTRTVKMMWRIIFLYQFTRSILAQTNPICFGDSSFRAPANSDIDVSCGSERVGLSILICPIQFNGYNESLMSLNSFHSNPKCKGEVDWSTTPPVLRFNVNITEESISECGSSLTISYEEGTGAFEDFSTVQFVNISGSICSNDPSNGAITYHQEVMYKFSCRYPLQYLVNNTEMNVEGVTLAVKDTNGSFISTLSMQLYQDTSYNSTLSMPLELKTRIFVEVKASNLTNRFHVLLDRCYTTASPFFSTTTYYDLFVGCNRDGQTVMGTNGEQQVARFSFEAFRFLKDHNLTISTYYVHCATRLCVDSICPSLVQSCTSKRRRRAGEADSVSTVATVTSRPIIIHIDNGYLLTPEGFAVGQSDKTVVAVSIIAGIIGAVCVTLVAFIVYNNYYAKKMPGLGKAIMYPQD
ncbi:zona pellucida-like domain-containing protein 1 [Eucyclogobius newberryi]|uniref:zona pellucida-like domain-containing protein 1 n=1 Tax=Eucyclogobius newberryi TaxID=166745 RepID=UPI003B5BB99C